MIGLKECVNWLLDNPGKELISVCNPHSVDGLEEKHVRKISLKTDREGHLFLCWSEDNGMVDLIVFETEEWKPVEELFCFQSAYNLCMLNGQKFASYEQANCELIMEKAFTCNSKKEMVIVRTKTEKMLSGVILTGEWYKI